MHSFRGLLLFNIFNLDQFAIRIIGVTLPRLGRSPGEGNVNPLQYSYLENSMDGEPWWATVHGVAKSRT